MISLTYIHLMSHGASNRSIFKTLGALKAPPTTACTRPPQLPRSVNVFDGYGTGGWRRVKPRPLGTMGNMAYSRAEFAFLAQHSA